MKFHKKSRGVNDRGVTKKNSLERSNEDRDFLIKKLKANTFNMSP